MPPTSCVSGSVNDIARTLADTATWSTHTSECSSPATAACRCPDVMEPSRGLVWLWVDAMG